MKSKKVLAILFAVMFLVMVGFGIIIPVLPFYAEELGGISAGIRLIDVCLFFNAISILTNVGGENL